MTFEVYIHVPFCLRRCGYCDFNTYTAADLGGGASRVQYAQTAIREMEFVAQWQRAHGMEEPAASSVFFGGGTPTILPASDLVDMLDAVRRIWGVTADAEITTEANPDTVDEAYISELACGGFNRISFGMQSAVPHVLRTLDRQHTPANVEAGIKAANDYGMRSSVDLIYGAPGESVEDWKASLDAAISLGVNHISAYALTVAPHTKMGRMIASGRLMHPDDDDEATKYEMAEEYLSAAGLVWYEISNWARPGYESRHNLGYWRNVDWAGIGPGAHSHYALHSATEAGDTQGRSSASRSGQAHPGDGFRKTTKPDADPTGGSPAGLREADAVLDANLEMTQGTAHTTMPLPSAGLRTWDTLHPKAWAQSIHAGNVPWQGAEGISPRADMEEELMLGLRLHEGLDTARFDGSIPIGVWRQLETEGLLTLHGADDEHEHRLIAVPTLRGRLLNDVIIERLFDYLP